VGTRASLDRCRKSRPHWDSIPDRPARSLSLYLLSYPAHSSFEGAIANVGFLALTLDLNLKTVVKTGRSGSNRCSCNSCLLDFH